MSGETQRQDDASEGDGRAWTPPPPHETPEPRLDDRYSSNLSQRPTPSDQKKVEPVIPNLTLRRGTKERGAAG